MLLYTTLLCKKIARASGGHKKFMLTKLGGRNRIDPKILSVLNSGYRHFSLLFSVLLLRCAPRAALLYKLYPVMRGKLLLEVLVVVNISCN